MTNNYAELYNALPTIYRDIVNKQSLFHYTSMTGFLLMMQHIDKKVCCLFPGHLRYQNDSREFSEGIAIAKNYKNTNHQDKINKCIDSINNNIFISCFCNNGDLLDQWKYYGKNCGVAIEFDFENCEGVWSDENVENICSSKSTQIDNYKICSSSFNKPSDYKNLDFKPNNIVMVSENSDKITRGYADLTPIKVLYKDNEKKEILDKIISTNMVKNMESLYVRTGEKNENEYINAAVSTFVPICKNKYFEHEEESRLLFFPSKQTKIQYREKNGRLLPFIKCYVVHKNSEKYPIQSITIGPGYNQNLVFNAIINLIEGENCVFFSEDTCNMILNDNSKCALDFESLKDNKTKKGLYFYKNTDDEKILVYVTSCGICIRKSSIPFRD